MNGSIIGAVTNVLALAKGESQVPGRAGLFFWSFVGPAHYRNIEIREINAVPDDVASRAD